MMKYPHRGFACLEFLHSSTKVSDQAQSGHQCLVRQGEALKCEMHDYVSSLPLRNKVLMESRQIIQEV